MAALRGLPQLHARAHLAGAGQAAGGHEGVVQRVEHQRRNADVGQVRLGRGAAPVVVGVAKAVQGRGEQVVEFVQVACSQQALAVEQARVLGQPWPGPWASSSAGTCGCRPAGKSPGRWRGRRQPGPAASRWPPRGPPPARRHGRLFGPAQQRIAAQRDACSAQRRGAARPQARQDPADFFKVARVIGPRRQVQLARAAPEMRLPHSSSHGPAPAPQKPAHSGWPKSLPGRGTAPARAHQPLPGESPHR